MPRQYNPTLDSYLATISNQKLLLNRKLNQRLISMEDADPCHNLQSERKFRLYESAEGDVGSLNHAVVGLNTANDYQKYIIFLAIAGGAAVWLLLRKQ